MDGILYQTDMYINGDIVTFYGILQLRNPFLNWALWMFAGILSGLLVYIPAKISVSYKVLVIANLESISHIADDTQYVMPGVGWILPPDQASGKKDH